MFFSTLNTYNDLLNPIYNHKIILITTLMIIILLKMHKSKPSRNVYLVNFACFKPKKSQQVSRETQMKRIHQRQKIFTKESLQTLWKMILASGIGDATHFPEAVLRDPTDLSLAGARRDAEAAIFGSMDLLLRVTGIKAEDIGVLVVNCSLTNFAPSLASMIVNRYKLRDDVKAFRLSGMGCSAGHIAIDLASQLLQVHPNTYAVVVSTEITSNNYYIGNDRQKLPMNSVMRAGGAAILLSNRPSDRHISNYQLKHSVRTNTASSDVAYGCIYHEEDPQGILGVSTSAKGLYTAITESIKIHFTVLGSLILPTSERLRFATNYFARKVLKFKLKPYSPNFGRSVDHVFPHVGAKPVLDVMDKMYLLDVEAARMTLYRFGNTSSSSVWYEMAYAEAKGKVKKGNILWQMGFGSGFKCNSLIWQALKDVQGREEHNPWSNEIDNFPVEVKDYELPDAFEK